jgi:cell division protein FtsX
MINKIKSIYKKAVKRVKSLNALQFAAIAVILLAILMAIQITFIFNDRERRRELQEQAEREIVDKEIERQVQNSNVLDIPADNVDEYNDALERNGLSSEEYMPSGSLLRELDKQSNQDQEYLDEIEENPPRELGH